MTKGCYIKYATLQKTRVSDLSSSLLCVWRSKFSAGTSQGSSSPHLVPQRREGLNFQSHRSNGRTECVLRPFNHSPFRHPLQESCLSVPLLSSTRAVHKQSSQGYLCEGSHMQKSTRMVCEFQERIVLHRARTCRVELQIKVGNVCAACLRQRRMAKRSQEGDMLVQQGPYRQTFKLQTFNYANLHSIGVRSEWNCSFPLPLSPTSDAPSAQPSPPPFRNSPRLLARCQPLCPSCCPRLLYVSRSCTLRWKMTS